MWDRCTFLRVGLVCICAASFSSCEKEAEQVSLEKDLALDKTNDLSTLSPKAQLGKLIFFDANLSEPGNGALLVQACASCHMPSQGFAGFSDSPLGMIPRGFAAGFAEGAVAGKIGGRRPPSAAYATFSPKLQESSGGFKGGLFWDGRATGNRLGSPAAEQALGPFLNPVEQNVHDALAILQRMQADPNKYSTLWPQVWGSRISTATQKDIDLNYDRVGLSIAAYEASNEVNKFSSKYDRYLKGQAALTSAEANGFALFTGQADCNRCHSEKSENGNPPLFTDFSYHNIGAPKNNSWAAPSSIDFGLGGFLQKLGPSNPWYVRADENLGKFKTPTLRNVAKGAGTKRFMHNGAFRTLEEVVHFYNTRDEPGAGWPAPEVGMNLSTSSRLGRLRLTSREEADLVAFIKTLSDD